MKKRGRPVITNWKERAWWDRIETYGFDENECWVTDVANANRMKLDYNGVQTTVRRYLWEEVRAAAGEPHLTWNDVVQSSASCISTNCVNPWHQVKTDRVEAGKARIRLLRGLPADEGGFAPATGLPSRSDASEPYRAAYLRMRLRLIGTGQLDATGVDMDYREELRTWATSEYPKLMKEAVDYVLGEPAKSTPKRDTAVETLLRTYPDLAPL